MRRNSGVFKLMSGAAVLAALLCVSMHDAYAQSSRELSNRLHRLENEVETLSRAMYRGETPAAPSSGSSLSSGPQAADMEIRLQQLEKQIRDLTGRVEEQSYATRQVKEALDKMSADLELRLGDLERNGSGSINNNGSFSNQSESSTINNNVPYTAKPIKKNPGDIEIYSGSNTDSGRTLGTISDNGGVAAVKDDSPAALYENAFSSLKSGNYTSAEREFEQFLSRYKDHPLAGNAKYWLGETFYVRGDFDRAARIFAEGYQQYPESNKSADNLLKLGLSLASVGNTKDACIALKQLEKTQANGLGPVMRRAEQEISRLGC